MPDELEDNCSRLSWHRSEYVLPDMYKTATLQKILVGQAKVNYDFWKSEGWTYQLLMTKLKEYARSKKLDKEANQGKKAVNMKEASGEPDVETWQEPKDEGGTLNAFANVKCYSCKKKGHYSSQCPTFLRGSGQR